MSRLLTGYASAYSADQLQTARVRRYQVRPLRVDFRAVLAGDTITAVTWETTHPESTYLDAPTIAAAGQSVAVNVRFNFPGFSNVKATVTTSGGQTLGYEFAFDVIDAPMYPTATYPAAGPYSVQTP